MPESRLWNARRSLPRGYQFGDAGKDIVEATFEYHGQSYYIRAPRAVLEAGGDWPRYRAVKTDLPPTPRLSDTERTE